jgi:hypothetical protein
MNEFVDPRTNPEPPARVSREPAGHGEELRELIHLCAAGRVYDVERWIQGGRPIQALGYKRPKKPTVVSPLLTAVRTNNLDLVLLLLCNGYRLDLEATEGDSVLDEALKTRAFDIVDLLLKWGADPTAVEASSVVDTYKTDLIDRFWRAGLDYTADQGFVSYLADTVNKPLYGWLRRNRSDQRLQDALDVALREAVVENREKPVHLLLWAGAEPHRRVPSARDLGQPDAWQGDMVSSSAEMAIVCGRHQVFDLLRVATMPDLEAQASRAHDSATLTKLVALRPLTEWSEVILTFIREMCPVSWRSSSWDAREALGFIGSSGGKLTTVSRDQMRWLRAELLGIQQTDDFRWLLRWLKNLEHCDPGIYEELTRTPAMRQKIEALNAGSRYLTPSQKMSRANDRRRRAKERKEQVTPGAKAQLPEPPLHG